jgi:hypothetical protein
MDYLAPSEAGSATPGGRKRSSSLLLVPYPGATSIIIGGGPSSSTSPSDLEDDLEKKSDSTGGEDGGGGKGGGGDTAVVYPSWAHNRVGWVVFAGWQAVLEHFGEGSVGASIFVLLSATLGAGTLAFPFAFKECGWVLAFVLMVPPPSLPPPHMHTLFPSLFASPQVRKAPFILFCH